MTADTQASNDQKMAEEAAERASVAEEVNSSDRSSQGSTKRASHAGGSAYSADCSGSASDEDEDEGPFSGSGSDDNNNNNNNHKQASSVLNGSAKSLLDSAQQDSEILSGQASSTHSSCSNSQQYTGRNDHVQQQDIESPMSDTDMAQKASHLVPSFKASSEGKVQYARHPQCVSSSGLHKPAITHNHNNDDDSSDNSSTSESSTSSGCGFTGPLARHPSDPRIDLSVVQAAQSLQDAAVMPQDNHINRIVNQHLTTTSTTQDNYHRLMEVSDCCIS